MSDDQPQRRQVLHFGCSDAPILGMAVGFIASLVLSVVYAVIGVVVETARQIPLAEDPNVVVLLPWVVFSLGLPVVLVIGIGPAVVFGTVAGALIGLLHAILESRVSCTRFVLIGFVSCAAISIGLHLFFGIRVSPSDLPVLTGGQLHLETLEILISYPYLVGIPSIVYIVVGTLGSFLLCRLIAWIRSRGNAPLAGPS